MERSQPHRYALLIGINSYVEKPLLGCVQDVRNIKDYLDSKAMSMDIDVLTASTSPDSSVLLAEDDPRQWPTRDNVISRLEAITASAQPGDFVYIHYSGHGTADKQSSATPRKHKSTADLALVLLPGSSTGTSVEYLDGLQLAFYLRKMVMNGLKVTLVLDCCFSGGVLRGGDKPENDRFLPFDPEIQAKSRPPPEATLGDSYAESASRDGSLLPNWMVRPDGYAILTACGPHETAKELRISGNSYAGALSHFLLRTLSRLGNIDAKHDDIYQHICPRFTDRSWPPGKKQMPMFFGNKNLSFFGVLKSDFSPRGIPVFRIDTGLLQLRAGQAHGVEDGDVFHLYPFVSAANSFKDQTDIVRAQVVETGPLTSTLIGLDNSQIPTAITTGWNARLLTRLALHGVPIAVAPDLPNLDQLLEATKRRETLNLQIANSDAQLDSFRVMLNLQSEFEICGHTTEAVVGFSPIPLAEFQSGLPCLMDALEHLTRFKQIEAITNRSPSSTIRSCFNIRIGTDDIWHDINSTIRATHGEELKLDIHNIGDKPLYVHIYDMGPLWQVENIFDGDHDIILPRDAAQGVTEFETFDLEMSIPAALVNAGKSSCHDIIKIFVTDEPTSFTTITMNGLSDAASKSALADLKQLPIFEHMADDGTKGRSAGDWAALNIHVYTSKQEESGVA